jgi:23S rRNA pseudouridine2605 synthase
MSKAHLLQTKLITFIRENTQWPRRKVLDKITSGCVTINTIPCTNSTTLIQPTDKIAIDGKNIQKKAFIYYKFHKPISTISTLKDPNQRRDLSWHIKKHNLSTTLRPCGRLDTDSSGLLIFSNDGDFIHQVLHPNFSIEKVYNITLNKPLSKHHESTLRNGLFLEDGPVKMEFLHKKSPISFTIKIFIGRNRILRRSFAHFGYTVQTLHRVSIGPIHLNNLAQGQFEPIPRPLIESIKSL